MQNDLVFSVVEIKALGSGLGRRLSVRLDGDWLDRASCNSQGAPQPAAYTIHAVLPYSPEYGTLQIGQRFGLVSVPFPEIGEAGSR